MQLVHNAGVVGVVILVTALGLVLYGVTLFFTARQRGPYWRLLLLAALPLLFGGAGAVVTMRAVDRLEAASPGRMHPAERERARVVARAPVVLGGAASLGLALLAVIGLVAQREEGEPLL